MAREVMTKTAVHGSNAGIVGTPAAPTAFNESDGMSLVVTGHETVVLYNPPGGSTRTVTIPSSDCSHHRLNDSLISARSIPSPGVLILPKFAAAGWTQGADGIELDASGAGLVQIVLVDPVD